MHSAGKLKNKLVRFILTAVIAFTMVLGTAVTPTYAAIASKDNSTQVAIYNYLSKAGFNNAAICGIMANLYRESGLKPTNVSNAFEKSSGYTDASYTEAVDNGSYTTFCTDQHGYGLAMWTAKSYKTGLYNTAKKNGTSVGNLNTQLEYLVTSLKASKAYTYLTKASNTAEGAYDSAYYMCYYYEVPANRASSSVSRGELAKDSFWPVFGKTAVTATLATANVSSATVSSATTSTESSASYSTGTYEVTATSLTVRSGADTTYKSLGTVKKGAQYTISSISNVKWGKITYNGKTGYISLKYCKKVTAAAASSSTTTAKSSTASTSASSSSGTSYKVTATTLTLRSENSATSKALSTIKKGTTITITDVKSSWGKTTYGGKTGYVCMKYCEKVTSSSTTTTTSTKSSGTNYKVTATTLTVREGKGTSYTALVNIPKNTVVTVTEVSGKWGKTTYKNKTGWIYLSYAEKQ